MSGALSELGMGGQSGPIASIINYYSSGGVQSPAGLVITANQFNACKEVLSGALSAGVLSGALVNITGRGQVNWLGAYTKDATARTVRLQLVIDGIATPQFDATTNSIAALGVGLVAVGNIDTPSGSTSMTCGFQPIVFNSSLVVKVASSRAESGIGNDQIAIGINHETWG